MMKMNSFLRKNMNSEFSNLEDYSCDVRKEEISFSLFLVYLTMKALRRLVEKVGLEEDSFQLLR